MIAVAVRQQQIAQIPARLESLSKTFDDQLRLHAGARIDQGAFLVAVKQVHVAVEIVRKRQFTAGNESHVIVKGNGAHQRGSRRMIFPPRMTSTGLRRAPRSSAGQPRTASRSAVNPLRMRPVSENPRQAAESLVAAAIARRFDQGSAASNSISPSSEWKGTPVAPASLPAITRTPLAIRARTTSRRPARNSSDEDRSRAPDPASGLRERR